MVSGMSPIIVILLICLGMFFVIKGSLQCQKCSRVIEYRFVPRTLQESQNDPVDVYDQFKIMFEGDNIST